MTLRMSSNPAIVLCLATALLAAPRCQAQVRGTVSLSTPVGVYIPTASLPPRFAHCLPEVICRISRQQSSAVVLGGRVTAWFNPRLALEGSVLYSPSPVATEFTSSFPNGALLARETSQATAAVVATSVRVLVSPVPVTRLWVYMVGGPAFVSRSGDAYSDWSGTTRFGGVVGAGAHLRVARSLALRAELEQYLYSLDGHHQRDVYLSLGLSLVSQVQVTRASTP